MDWLAVFELSRPLFFFSGFAVALAALCVIAGAIVRAKKRKTAQ